MQFESFNKIDRSKASRTSMVKRRVAQLKEEIKADTQKIRLKTIEDLQEIFNVASALARGEVKHQTENGKAQKLTLSQRQKWARVAAYIAQIINSVSNTFDERQIDQDLAKLEELINEAAAKTKTKTTGTATN